MPSEMKKDSKSMKENGEPKRSYSKEDSSNQHERQLKPSSSNGAATSANEESVEVILGEMGGSTIVESPERPRNDQSIFRHPQAVRPRVMRPPNGPPPPPPPPPPRHPHYPYSHASGSWGYHGPPHSADYPPPPPPPPQMYPTPSHNPSRSFDDQYRPYHTPHYSPHVHYPPPRYPSEEVNVISPNHKTEPPHYRTPVPNRSRTAPSSQNYYHYPPTSPVSRSASNAPSSGPPRLRNYAMRRGEGSYSRAQRESYRDDPHWGAYPPPPPPPGPPPRSSERPLPPVVAESFDSEAHSRTPSTPAGANAHPHHPPPPSSSHHDPYYSLYGGGSWGSFDSAAPPPQQHPPQHPPHFDDQRYYGFPPPDSPYSPYATPYSPGGASLYRSESFPPPPPPPTSSIGPYAQTPPSFTYSYDEEERFAGDYHQAEPPTSDYHLKHVTPPGSAAKSRAKTSTPVASNTTSSSSGRNMILPKAAEEIDFDVTDPPMEPVLPPSDDPICETLADVNSDDVLCGRGGGTNSQIGNRRFRKLVQEFQPTYLMAKRKEKPLLARTIVLIIRKRGGRFLKKNEETGELFEVGDAKAEAKTSQALREGLDVRATRSAANSMSDKKKKKCPKSPDGSKSEASGVTSPGGSNAEDQEPESPPTLPKLHGEEKAGTVNPHSPEHTTFRKRRRVRSTDRFFPDFCPPRADLGRGSPSLADMEDDGVLDVTTTPIRRNGSRAQEEIHYDNESIPPQGCAGIAMDLVTGAATGSFCLGPTGWRR